MTHSLRDIVAKHGYAFVQQGCPGPDFVAFAEIFGRLLTPWPGGLIQELVPKETASPNTYSGIFGLNRFPFHTDLAHWCRPPHYLLLRCVSGYFDVPTLLVDGQAIVETIGQNILNRAIFIPRRPRNNKLSLLRLYESTEVDHCFRWDEVFLKPASKIGEAAAVRVRDYLNGNAALSIPLVQTGDVLLIDNWRMLHARSPVPSARMDRKILRIYLDELT